MEYTPVQYLSDVASGNSSETPLVCYAATMMSMNGMLQGENPLDFTFPIFLFQLFIILLTSRITAIILKPLRQPRYISEILGGFILGPTLMGRLPAFALTVFPFRSLLVLDSMASVGLVFFMFIVGVEIDPDVVRRVVRRSTFVSFASLLGPVLIGILAGLMLHGRIQDGTNPAAFATFLCSILCVASFSVLARILADLKLIASNIGRLVLSSAMIMNGAAWVLMIFSTSLSQSRGRHLSAIWAVVSGGLFSVAVYMAVRRAARWVQKRTPEGEEVAELHLCVLLVGVMVSAFAADTIGTHAIFGAFVYGLAVPNGPLGELLIDKIGDFIEGLLLPLFFAICGFRTNLYSVVDAGAAWLLLIVVAAAIMTKAAGSLLAAFYMEMPFRDGISMGLLLNTKGVIELIMLNIGWDKRVLHDQTFTILVIISVVTTTLITPLVKVAAKPSRRTVAYKRRTVRWWNPESELRMLLCAHASREVPSLISLLDISHPTKRSPFFVYALYLVELTGRASTLFAVNTNSSSSALDSHRGAPSSSGGFIRHQTESEHISHAFESYEQHVGGVSVQSLTAFSQYSSMHEDVIALAEDKHCALILLPFHKHQTIDGTMEVTHPAIRSLNQNVLTSASCSVGILIDRSLAGTGGARAQRYSVALLFIGGPDDREALAYADRLATNPSVALTVVRFLPCIGVDRSPPQERVVDVAGENDDECLARFQAGGGGEAEYVERMVGNAEETVTMLREMEGRYDLYIVGIGKGISLPFTAGLAEWSECEELGPIGDLLASPDFGSRSSVLVLQSGKYGEESGGDTNGGAVAVSVPANPGR